MNIAKQIFPAIMLTLVLTVLVGIVYPLVVTGVAQVLFKEKAEGSLLTRNGTIVGSRLIGQSFRGAGYFHSRPSAAGKGYDATSSGGTNLGPTSKKLLEEQVQVAAASLSEEKPGTPIPVDLVTTSASGFDPHITPAAAEFQVSRVARERHMSDNAIRELVRAHTEGRQLGVLGEPRVKVLELNLALDAMKK